MQPNDTTLLSRITRRIARVARRRRVRKSIRHVHGPSRTGVGPQDTTVVALVRDGAFYLGPFLEHYRALGARHFVFIDNGSEDDTLDILKQQPDATVIQSLLPWGEFENDLRQYAALTFCAGSWCLYADMDEMFDFEGGGNGGLPRLARYLSQHGYTALVAQMLEMFPDAPLSQTAHLPYDKVLQQFRYYDLSDVIRVPYHDTETIHFSYFMQNNSTGNEAIQFCFGGVRRTFFDEMCCLTKHPLVFVGLGVEPGGHPHCSAHVACADFTALIRHYKFANDPVGRDTRTVQHSAIGHGEDQLRLNRMSDDPDLSLMSESPQEYRGLAPLYDAGFLVSSDRFTAWMSGDD